MQLIDADKIRKCVVFIGQKKAGVSKIRGTAFFVAYQGHKYLVTAKHNIISAEKSGAECLLVRFNNRQSGTSEYETEFSAWRRHPDPFTDVAILDISDEIDTCSMDVALYPAGNHVNATVIKDMPVTVGDDVFFPGLFNPHAGVARNVPVVRSGNIAAMAEEPVSVDWFGTVASVEAYLVEARSLGGLSGSPVFVHFPLRRREIEQGGQKIYKIVAKPTEHCILGLVHGHYDERQSENGASPNRGINMGMAIVVPFTKVMELFK